MAELAPLLSSSEGTGSLFLYVYAGPDHESPLSLPLRVGACVLCDESTQEQHEEQQKLITFNFLFF